MNVKLNEDQIMFRDTIREISEMEIIAATKSLKENLEFSRTLIIYEGTSEMHRLVICRLPLSE